MIPTGYAEHQIGVRDLLFIHFFTSLSFQSICAIPAGFGYGALVDLADTRQDYVVLVICSGIKITAIAVFA
jgi:hypothetical protein